MGAEYMSMMEETSFDHDVARVVAVDAENLRAIGGRAGANGLSRVMAAGQDDQTQTRTERTTRPVPPKLCRRREPSEAAALSPQSIQHPAQHSVTEAITGLLSQEIKRTNGLK
jgi:hypothetical protein